MDVYGYGPWQYTNSDDLSNQMFAQQALGSGIPYNRNVPEAHAMPAPSGAPWNPQGIPWGMPGPQPHLMQFTAQTHHPPTTVSEVPKPLLHCKRKPVDMEPVIPAKQLITEEKMAAHLNGLHISSNYTSHSLCSDEMMDMLTNMESQTQSISDQIKGRTLVLSEELKKIKSEPILPPEIIDRIEKPCMSLVLWKPKETVVEEILDDKLKSEQSNERTRRKGVLIQESATMDVEM